MDDAAFLEELIELFKKYGVADWALVARTVDGESLFPWFAGQHGSPDGDNVISNRERAANLHFDVCGLAQDILRKNFMPVNPESVP